MVWVSGEWKITCDRCSKEILASEAMKEWTGLIVCNECFEERHPLDFIRARKEDLTVPFSRPEPPDTFIYSCNIPSSSGYADLGTADCMRANETWGMTYWQLLNEYVCSEDKKTAIAGVGYAGCMIPAYNIDAYF